MRINNKQTIAIIDYGTGNLSSVKNAFAVLRQDAVITDKPNEIENASAIVFPGVGNFGFMMKQLIKRKLDVAITKAILDGKKFLGICLGMQALFEESEESPKTKGLGIFRGKVVKFTSGKVPQIGWNKILPENKKGKQKNNLFTESYMYFVNSYYIVPKDKSIIAAKTDYNGKFACAVKYKNITAIQFHPEKSGKQGIELLRRWLES
ncbi:imidazole glycerol phosphate synthase subunit HisH [Candidatus Woesearchaeota archaeon]|nr:imidazole glycerol phosphate synthase subunit HisH [Candidatus Woesearchaeota archaeon]